MRMKKKITSNNSGSIKINQIHNARYDFLNYCRSVLIDIIKYADKNELSKEEIVLKNESDKVAFEEVCTVSQDDASNWLLKNGYENIIYGLTYKHIFFSLVVDFSNYYIASLEQAAFKNMSVAWTLMRRPLQETLAYIEWLYVNKYELPKIMLNSNSTKEYEFKGVNKNLIKKHIYEAFPSLKDGNEEFEGFDLYDFRYGNNDVCSLNGILNGANHLITTRNKTFMTSPSSLNFVFPTKEHMEKYEEFYFTSMPCVMYFAMDIIIKLFSEIAGFNPYTILMNIYNLRLKNLKALQTITLEEALERIDVDLPIYCPHCGSEMKCIEDWKGYAHKEVKCNKCRNKVDTFGFIFDFEEIDFNQT